MPWIADISEVGRSIKIPKLEDTSDASLYPEYKISLTPPVEVLQVVENGSLAIELDVDMKPEDEVYAFASFKLYWEEEKSWTEAELHCESEGGQLASIHSHWEQTLAKKADGGSNVWLGGRMLAGQWQWVDNVTWNFTNWENGYPGSKEYLMMKSDGLWIDQSENT